jgi:hypothetical protein
VWSYEEFLAKAKLYFERSAGAASLRPDDGSALWLLLGLEFLLRAPLARVSPTLLAWPEGVSILHAAGYTRVDAFPRSIGTKTVVDRLIHIDANFGKDRGKDALYLADLRNSEIHTSAAALANVDTEVWLPKFLAVVEAVCNHVGVSVEDMLPEDVIAFARDLTERVDRELQKRVDQAIKDSRYHYEHLTAEEVAARTASPRPESGRTGDLRDDRVCPACGNQTATVLLSPGGTSASLYDEEDDVIRYSTTYLAQSLHCRVCGLDLETTAAVMATGIDRLYVVESEEDRYEGWEERITYEQAIGVIGAEEGDYMNE